FDRERFEYASCDGQKLSFADATVSFALFNESLHHLPDPPAGLDEAFRVLRPGGRVFLFEPYAYDPWRRISEVRDYFKGTIETSFSVRRLTRMLDAAGFTVTHLDRVVYISKAKLPRLGPLHRAARIAYYNVRKALPDIFGMIAMVAEKPATGATAAGDPADYTELLRCPVSGSRLLAADGGFVTDDRAHPLFYPAVDGIPVLIADDSRALAEDEWSALVARASEGR
ncbi:MAG: methyltransferase domain-containing protein, partial [Alphaproteobacteria bacterium]